MNEQVRDLSENPRPKHVQEFRGKEGKLSKIVAGFIKRRFHCHVTTELKVGSCQFDVVGFNENESTFYVVETKLGYKPASIGQAFGQLLAYDAVISQDGYEFIKEFFDKLAGKEHDPISYEVSSRISDQPNVTVYRFVALLDRACSNYNLIRSLRQKLTRPIGVIRFDRRCKLYLSNDGRKDYDICKSEPVTIGITKRYSREEFLQEVSNRMRRIHPNLTSTVYSKTKSGEPRGIKLHLGHSGFHLEANVSKRVASTSLDVELGRRMSDRRRKDRFFLAARRTLRKLKHQVDGLKVERNWANRKCWGRVGVYEDQPELNEDFVNKSVDSLNRIYEGLGPVIESFVR